MELLRRGELMELAEMDTEVVALNVGHGELQLGLGVSVETEERAEAQPVRRSCDVGAGGKSKTNTCLTGGRPKPQPGG